MKLLLLLLPLLLFSDINMARKLVVDHEGFRSHLYRDAGGYSIGYGTNFNHGISKEEAKLLLNYRLKKSEAQLTKRAWFHTLSPTRKAVLIDLNYNLGITGVLLFKDMIRAIKQRNYHKASIAMKDSLWYKQTGKRAKNLVKLMRKG